MKEEKIKQKTNFLNTTLDSPEPEGTMLVEEEESTKISEGSYPDLGAKYAILEYIGDGGMGAVYKVQDNELNSIVAIKILKQELVSDKAALKRFEQESKSLSELNHPNLVTVYGSGQTSSGTPFIIMDYLDGEDLATILKRESILELDRIINLTEQICDGLSHAHKNGIVHRDIKPSNILITNEGGKELVKILDFGIAKIVESAMGNTTNLTQTGEVFGTPTYMSPEQCETGAIDKRSDIYSLGCVMYEMLIGKPPFQGNNPIQVAVKHINDEPEKFSKNILKIKHMQSMESIVLGCLSKEPANRYKSTDALKADLVKLLDGTKINRFLINDKDTRPKWLLNCCILAVLLSVYAICGVTTIQIGDLIINSGSNTPISVVTSSLFIALNFFGMIMFTICAKSDLKYVHAVDAKVSHFWLLGESISFTFLLLFGSLLYLIPNFMDVTSGLTGLLAAFMGFIFVLATLICIVNSCLAAIYTMKIFKKWNNPLSKKLLVKQWLASSIVAILVSLPAFALFPKPLSYIPLGLGVMVSSPAPHFASKLVDISLLLEPENEYAIMQNAYITNQVGDKTEAIALVNKALKKSPDSISIRYSRAKLLHYVGRNEEAVKDLDKLIKSKPGESKYYKLKADLELELKHYSSAIKDFSTLIKLDPKEADNYRKRALLYALANNFEDANDDMTKAMILGSNYYGADDFLRIAMINDLAGDKNKAKEFYKKAIAESSNNSFGRKAYAYKQLGNMKEFKKYNKLIISQEFNLERFKKNILFDIDFPMNW